MSTEFEVKVLDIDKQQILQKIVSVGGTHKGSYYFRRHVFNTIPHRDSEWLRLRTDGSETTLTYKCAREDSIDGVEEIEISVDNFDDTLRILEKAGLESDGYQENKRELYDIDGAEVCVDEWPLIPAYLEIEGSSIDHVEKVLHKLNLFDAEKTSSPTAEVYKRYKLDIKKLNPLKF